MSKKVTFIPFKSDFNSHRLDKLIIDIFIMSKGLTKEEPFKKIKNYQLCTNFKYKVGVAPLTDLTTNKTYYSVILNRCYLVETFNTEKQAIKRANDIDQAITLLGTKLLMDASKLDSKKVKKELGM